MRSTASAGPEACQGAGRDARPDATETPAVSGPCRARGDIETENLPAHVALCRERYGTLNRRLLRLEILYGGLVTTLAAIAVRLWTGG